MTRWLRVFPRAAVAAAVALAADRAAGQDSPVVPVSAQPDLPPELSPIIDTPAVAAPKAGSVPAATNACCDKFDFNKIPPVAMNPRPGMFNILPSGPGYYSLLDQIRGDCKDGPPKSGYPLFPLMSPGFFDADFRYLDDPNTPPADLSDRLKRVHLGDNWLFSTGGQFWNRYMNESNSRLTRQSNDYDLFRVRMYGDLWYKDVFRVYVEGIYADAFNENLAPLPIDRNRGDFQNLFIDLKVGEIGGEPVYVRTGRQELLFGSQRLISPLDWANTRRTFEGVRAFRQSETFDIDAFWVRPVVPNPTRMDSWDDKQDFAGAWATFKPKKGTTVDLYYMYLSNTNVVTQVGLPRSPLAIHTFGSRYAGDVDNTFLWDFEGAMQLGEQTHKNVVAGMYSGGLGYHAKVAWDPTFWITYDYASGTTNPNGSTLHTFNQLFPFGHYYFGWTDLIGRQNIDDLNCALYLYPEKWLTTWLQFHWFALDQAKDALYNTSGAAYRRDPTGQAGRDVGRELDVIFNFHLTKRSDLLTSYGYLWGGNFLRNTSGPNAAVNASVYSLMYNYRW
jgi:hypothetical protein